MPACCCRRACRALTVKNLLLKRRTPISTLLEVLLPLAFVGAMYGIKGLFNTDTIPAADHVTDRDSVAPIQGLAPVLALTGRTVALIGPGAAAFAADAATLYLPFNGSTFAGGVFTSPVLRAAYLPPLPAAFRTFASESDLESYIIDPSYGDASHPAVHAAIVFNSAGGPGWDYTLRFNASDVPNTSQPPVNTYSTTYRPGSLNSYLTTYSRGSYGAIMPGFLSLQLAIDRWILNRSVPTASIDPLTAFYTLGTVLTASGQYAAATALQAEVAALSPFISPEGQAAVADVQAWLASEARAPQQVDFIPFPVPPYRSNTFFTVVLQSLTLFFVIAYVFPVSQLIRGLVLEKELRLREVLKQMGAWDSDIWGAWIGTYMMLYLILCLGVTGLASQIFPASEPGVMFVLFYLYSLASIGFALLISVFFTKSRTASVIGGLCWIAGYFAYFGITDSSPMMIKGLASLLAPTSLGLALQVIGTLETNGVGATRVTAITADVNNWTVSSSIGMLITDILLYLFLAWYLDQVLPSWAREYGVPRPFYFILTPSFWAETCGCGKKKAEAGSLHSTLLDRPAHAAHAVHDWTASPSSTPFSWLNPFSWFAGSSGSAGLGAPMLQGGPKGAEAAAILQPYDAALKAKEQAGRCVSVRGLTKVFSTPTGPKVAVAGVDLDFFEGQVTCLLGHNGAGKTTTLQMLAGLIPPTAGAAESFGIDIFHDQAGLRKMLGVCPQHDVLWPELTVSEHLRLFAAMKGVPSSEVQSECAKSLSTLGMTDKAEAAVNTLSGGMKRKLSIMLAFLGGSKVVFLDEPTSGVDPYSRRAMWSIIQRMREGRVIILTTHFMDEADILGDRIAIMHGGRLHCAGTSVFLKEAFGVGYTCTVVKAAVGAASDAHLLSVVKENVPEAVVASSAGSEVLIRLPLSASAAFPALLRALESRASALGVVDVGMSVTSLESVFLRVASDGHTGDLTKAGGAALSGAAAGADGAEGDGNMADRRARVASAGGAVSANPLKTATAGAGGLASVLLEDDKDGSSTPLSLSMADGFPVTPSASAPFWPHVRAIFIKRAQVGRRDYRSVCCLLLVPLIIMIVGLVALQSALSLEFPSYQFTTYDFNAASTGRRGGRPGPPVPGGGGGSKGPQYPNYIPAFTYKSVTGNGTDVAGLGDIISTIPTANASTDGGKLLLGITAASTVPDPYGFIDGSDPSPDLDYERMSAFLVDNAPSYAASKYGAYVFTRDNTIIPGQTTTDTLPNDNAVTVGIFVNTTAVHAGPTFLNLLNTALLRRAAGVSGGDAAGPSITTRTQPLPFTYIQRLLVLTTVAAISLQPLELALAIVPAACAYFVVREREVGAKHQQTISGVSLAAYWLANWAFDSAASVVAVLFVVAVLAGFNVNTLIDSSKDRTAATVLLLLGYAGASTSFTYLLAHAFKSPSAAQAAVVMLNLVTFAVVVATTILAIIPSTCTAFPAVFRGLDLLPFFAAGQGFTAISQIDTWAGLEAQCSISNGRKATVPAVPTTAFASVIAGYPLAYLAVETVVYLVLAWAVDYLRSDMVVLRKFYQVVSPITSLFGRCWPCRRGGPARTGHTIAEDADVRAEAARIDQLWQAGGHGGSGGRGSGGAIARAVHAQSGSRFADGTYGSVTVENSPLAEAGVEGGAGATAGATAGHGAAATAAGTEAEAILLHHLRKVYPGGKVAVNDLSFSVPAGQVFGFLGVNGAGKTSTMAMLTGAALPTSGSARLAGLDIIEDQMQVRRLLGFVPQFDSHTDLLSVTEHLELYARIKGVPEYAVPGVAARAVREFDLEQYKHALAGTLSGGNKRKLCVAVALISSPPLVFLDEPTTGVDPVARRKLWGMIARAASQQKKCSIILTTHSMEEAEALCTRIGIMVNGQLACIGTAQRLRTVHGSGYSCEMRLGEPPRQQVEAVVQRLVQAGLCGVGADLPEAASPTEAGSERPVLGSGLSITAAGLAAACTALGNPVRLSEIRADGRGWAIYALLAAQGQQASATAATTATAAGPAAIPSDSVISAAEFAVWWLEEEAVDVLLAEFIGNSQAQPPQAGAFPGSTFRERQGRTLKMDVPSSAVGSRTLADLFECLEHIKGRVGLETATLSQTTLEQVFNRMAAMQ